MNILTAEQLTKSYGQHVLFADLSFSMEERDRVGIIGVNGAGKSSLLRAIAGKEPADRGTVAFRSGLAVEYLPQNPAYDPDATIIEQLFKGDSPAVAAVRDYERALAALSVDPANRRLQDALLQQQMRMESVNGWQLEDEANRMLSILGIADRKARMGQLSGGQRKRVMLAGVLVRPSDLLILDEPTNHLDTETIDWLETTLLRAGRALLMITHDRYFLDRVANRTLELDRGRLYAYDGNYSRFLELKAEREAREQAEERKRRNLFRSELEWIRRGAKARTTKQKARIERFEKLEQSLSRHHAAEMEIALSGTRLGKKVFELTDVSFFRDGRPIVRDFSTIVQRHDRIGIVGPNGIGKSTLLNVLTGRLRPDRGTVAIGETVRIGYYGQEFETMDPNRRVIDYIKDTAEHIRLSDGSSASAAQMLERFLFSPEQQWSPIGRLSGGEQRRLYLLNILMNGPNVLLLDEPTNDLDIHTLALLEAYLDDFAGAVLFVSHDRYFLDRVAETIWAFDTDGRISRHTGNYSDYAEARGRTSAASGDAPADAPNAARATAQGPSDETAAVAHKRKALRFSYQEQKDYEQIEGWIEETEKELREIAAQMAEAGSDFVLLQRLTVEQQALEAKLEQLMERWAYLEELAVEIEKQKGSSR